MQMEIRSSGCGCTADNSFDHTTMHQEVHTMLVPSVLPTVPKFMALMICCLPKS